MMTTDSETRPTISGGPLNGEYVFDQLHYHWGDSDDHGSEDEIDGVSYPMELHMVFYKKEYLDSTSALDHSDGLCVVACLFEVSDVHNDNFNAFAQVLPRIIEAETETVFDVAPALIDLLPYDINHYFTYNGSLTTPPCSEVVTWIDFKDHIKLSHDQFEDFRALRNKEDRSMSNNFRAVQPLGDRIVLYNVHLYETFFDEKVEQQRLVNDIDQLNAEFNKGVENL
ncbi:hypothetical protein HA402_009373 [Bradysia odoriphaga]|nr:hypothetical protein HA402_009373 [Bradysia odoriphaga]